VTSEIALFLAAVVCLTIGHVLRAARWGLFILPFQQVRKAHLLRSLAFGYALNAVVPFRLGEVARAYALHRESGLSFMHALSTVALDRLCDLLVVVLMLVLLVVVGHLPVSLPLPLAVGAGALALLALAASNHWLLKRVCFSLAAPFNDRIRRWLLMGCWSFFTAVQMLARRRTAALFAVYTAGMWTAYVAAFLLVTRALFPDEAGGFIHRLADHYLVGNLPRSTLAQFSGRSAVLYMVFMLAPLALIVVYGSVQARLHRALPILHWSLTRTFHGMFSAPEHIRLLPFLDAGDQRLYLESFFASFDNRAVLTLIRQNQDIAVVRNVSGGSNATTMLALYGDRLIYRKYALGGEAGRLHAQHAWLREHAGRLPLTPIIAAKEEPGYFSYDMPHSAEAYDLFTYIHSHDVEASWALITRLLDTLAARLHHPTRRAAPAGALAAYLREKYLSNLLLTLHSPRCAALAAHDHLTINHQRCRNLGWYARRFDPTVAAGELAGDHVCTVHGDLTAENIIVDPRSRDGYYLIDPNPANLFDSEMIDFAKLRQSLHFGYEFLVRESSCRVQGDEIRFRHPLSQAYQELGARFDRHLLDRFGPAGMRSVCFHELVHYTRMMPYKIRQGEVQAQVFYAALVVLHNRFHQRFREHRHDRTIAAA
jgi:hypothetical protein